MRANEQTDERVAQYFFLDSWLKGVECHDSIIRLHEKKIVECSTAHFAPTVLLNIMMDGHCPTDTAGQTDFLHTEIFFSEREEERTTTSISLTQEISTSCNRFFFSFRNVSKIYKGRSQNRRINVTLDEQFCISTLQSHG